MIINVKEYFENSWIHARFVYRTKPLVNGCVEWLGAKSKSGYGQITITTEKNKSKTKLCHRVLWEITHKVMLRRNQFICHSCDNPACVNVNHLWLGTAKANSLDMASKGRSTKGISRPYDYSKPHKKPKLHTRQCVHDDAKIRAIRAATGKHKWIADEYGVSIGYVSKIKSMKAKTLI